MILSASIHSAQKPYGCAGCKKRIDPGSRYVSAYSLGEGAPSRSAFHPRCASPDIRAKLSRLDRAECSR